MNADPPTNPRCARLTAGGRGAIAVVALRGDGLTEILEPLFQPFNQKPFSQCLNRRLVYGVWQTTGEDVVVFNRDPKHLEIHCHGGSAAVSSIMDALVEAGAATISAAELTETSSDCIWNHEIADAVTQATTQRTASYLLRQLESLPAAVADIDSLHQSGRHPEAMAAIDRVLEWSDFGCRLTEVPSVVLCGQPNVGKSSLINAIVGFQRAIVHNTPGTTRDVVTQQTAVDGWPIELKDTAGLRDGSGAIERIGIENAREQIDGSAGWSANDQSLIDSLDPKLVVLNKADLKTENANANSPSQTIGRDRLVLNVSAETGEGIDSLITAIANQLVPKLPPPESSFCVSAVQVTRLQQLRERITAE